MRLSSLSRYNDYVILFVRLAAAFTFLVHGMGKWVLWENYEEMSGLMQFLSVAEPLCAIGLAFGFLSRWAALGGGLVMISAIWTKMIIWGVSFVDHGGIGWEIDLLLLSLCIVIFFQGPGELSVDTMLRSPGSKGGNQ